MTNDEKLGKLLIKADRKRIDRAMDGNRPTVGDILAGALAGMTVEEARETLTGWFKEKRGAAINIELRREVARDWLRQVQ